MDTIHTFDNFDTCHVYEKICAISSEIQALIDKNDLADFILVVLQKQRK